MAEFPPAPREFKLHAFLINIAERLNEEDLFKMKFIMQGPGGIEMSTLSSISKPIAFIEELKSRNFVNINNFLILQTILWYSGRRDLYEEMVKFAEEQKGVLYTHSANPEPEPGFSNSNWHVEVNLTREALEELQRKVASWLIVPQHFVVVAGVENTESLNIVLMIPRVGVQMLRKHARLNSEWLMARGIDRIEVDGESIDLTEMPQKPEKN